MYVPGLRSTLPVFGPCGTASWNPLELGVREQERVRATQVVVVDLGDPGRGAELGGLEAQRRQGVDLQGGDRRPRRLLEAAAAFGRLLAGAEREKPADRMSTMNPASAITSVDERSRGVAEMAAPPTRIPTVTIVPTRTDMFSPLARNTRERFTT